MDTVLDPFLRKCVLLFFDDILISSNSNSQQVEEPQGQVDYLGHIVRKDGVVTNPMKVEEMVKWPTHTNIYEIRIFLGLTSYYGRFIQNYGIVCKHIYVTLLKMIFLVRGAKLCIQCTQIWSIMVQALLMEPLGFADPCKPFGFKLVLMPM
jgi:hypothetical protein